VTAGGGTVDEAIGRPSNGARVPVAVVGSGNIGTDLVKKLLRSPILDPAVLVGIDPASDGLAKARWWGVETTVGKRRSTVIKPRSACANTRPTASQATRRSGRCQASRLTVTRVASVSVRMTTVPAASRWLCSTATPPCMTGIIVP